MFRGISNIAVDAKGRISIPKTHREQLLAVSKGELMVTAGPDRCLLVFPLDEWWPTEEKILSLPNTNKIHRQMQHLYIGYATETEVDNNGRIHLPPMLREYACMDRKAVMIGQGRRLEIWGEEIWRDKSSNWPEIIAEVEADELSEEAQALFI